MPAHEKSKSIHFEEPIRSEIFSVSELERHGGSLATAQTIGSKRKTGKEIYSRLSNNKSELESAYVELLKAAHEKRAITPAAEWLIDNFHIVRAQLLDIHEHLPPVYYNELPKLADGPLKGLPRVYGIAWAFAAHTDSRFDASLLKTFLASYQAVQSLTIGELWAVSITLRLVYIENLRRLAVKIVASQDARQVADKFSDELLGLQDGPPREINLILRDLEQTQFVPTLGVQLLQRLRFQEAKIDPILEWIENRLQREGLSPDEIANREHNSQTAANATVRNIITSFRTMSAFDWQEFFEEVSLVEGVLRSDDLYSSTDFTTRDRYRHALEELARHSLASEVELAQLVTRLKLQAIREKRPAHQQDIGYWLISSGRSFLETMIDFRPPLRLLLLRWYLRYGTAIYISFILVLSAAFVSIPLSLARQNSTEQFALFLLGFLGLFPALEIAVSIVNRVTVSLLGPRHLPRLELAEGIPEELRTFVVVPTLLTDLAKIEGQAEQLEIHYLSNSDGYLHFALLTDWVDSDSEVSHAESLLADTAREYIAALNSKYGKLPDETDRFYLFHRRRQFNAGEKQWIGWERKRGKLQEFNRLLRGAEDTSYLMDSQLSARPPVGVRYVITLDADTRLPNGAAAQLIGTAAHPLNRPVFNEDGTHVIRGYGILQPRITPTLPLTSESTIFQKLSSGPSGIDPYAAAVSDVYQDLFNEGSFVGKGIYDVDAFEAALKGKIPENALLSHDLLEGNYARCGFLSDVEFFEDFPSHSGVAAARTHRWIRGDWQLLPFLLSSNADKMRIINRWKILDNLRRSISPAIMFVSLVAAFSIPTSAPWSWAILFILAIGHSALFQLLAELQPHRNTNYAQHVRFAFQEFYVGLQQTLMTTSLLVYQAALGIDALTRALYRLTISREHLLEWTTAAQSKASSQLSLRSFVMSMRGTLILTALGLLPILIFNPIGLVYYSPFFLIWILSPLIAQKISSAPKEVLVEPLGVDDIQLLNSTARRIWLFFATFVTAEENFLPPDNFQEIPEPVVAHRTSPTNFGLYLLSVVAARDFGWIGLVEMTKRLGETLRSMETLPRYEGHFFNWYETTEARALEPRYLSSVDNGNLAGHLVAVAEACTEILGKPISGDTLHRGSLQTVLQLEKSLEQLKSQLVGNENLRLLTGDEFERIVALSVTPDHMITSRAAHWRTLIYLSRKLAANVETVSGFVGGGICRETLTWALALENDIRSAAQDFSLLSSWTDSKTTLSSFEFIESSVSLEETPMELRSLVEKLRGQNSIGVSENLFPALELSILETSKLIDEIKAVRSLCMLMIHSMDFGLLYDRSKKLFSIGYRVVDNELDSSCYDLLASEARLTSFIAIAKGDVPSQHWFKLGRGLTLINNAVALVSWSGSMFEYLMPSLVMSFPPGSLLDKTCRLIIKRQIEYGQEKNVPWGISESAYNQRDLHLTYQYSNFGVPDLGLKRGLGADLVIAPYASFLAAMYEPAMAVANLHRLKKLGAEGLYGFYEAVDFTASRLPEGQSEAIVKTYMAHHQGMSLISIANIFKNGLMRDRFHAAPAVQATELLLQERTPRNVGITKPNSKTFNDARVREDVEPSPNRIYRTFNRAIPTTQLLGNANISLMLTSAGSGYSRYRELAINRWREDVTRDNWGQYIYVRDLSTPMFGRQPTSPRAWSPIITKSVSAEIGRGSGARITTFSSRQKFLCLRKKTLKFASSPLRISLPLRDVST